MSIEEKVFATLSGAAAVTALVPAERIRPDGVYQALERPYMRYVIAAVTPIHLHDGVAALKEWQVQVSVFAETRAHLAEIREAVVAALDLPYDPKFFFRSVTGPLQELDSTDTPVIGEGLLFDAWSD